MWCTPRTGAGRWNGFNYLAENGTFPRCTTFPWFSRAEFYFSLFSPNANTIPHYSKYIVHSQRSGCGPIWIKHTAARGKPSGSDVRRQSRKMLRHIRETKVNSPTVRSQGWIFLLSPKKTLGPLNRAQPSRGKKKRYVPALDDAPVAASAAVASLIKVVARGNRLGPMCTHIHYLEYHGHCFRGVIFPPYEDGCCYRVTFCGRDISRVLLDRSTIHCGLWM